MNRYVKLLAIYFCTLNIQTLLYYCLLLFLKTCGNICQPNLQVPPGTTHSLIYYVEFHGQNFNISIFFGNFPQFLKLFYLSHLIYVNLFQNFLTKLNILLWFYNLFSFPVYNIISVLSTINLVRNIPMCKPSVIFVIIIALQPYSCIPIFLIL